MTYHEQHSPDGQTFIRRLWGNTGRWEVWLRGTWIATWFRRSDAREHIRAEKRKDPSNG